MTLYNTNVDLVTLVNDNVYTKFGLIRSIHFQDIEQKLNYDQMTERLTERLTERKKDGQGESSIAPLEKVDCMELEVDTPIKIVYMIHELQLSDYIFLSKYFRPNVFTCISGRKNQFIIN